MKHYHSRRGFLTQLGLGCASVGTTSLLSGITNLGLINAAAAANRPIFAPANNGYKAIVCLMLSGGNDSYNMLVPRGDTEYQEYADVRTNLALAQDSLRPINPLNDVGQELGLHPNLENIQGLFDSGNAAFVANIGALVRPTTMAQFELGNNLPQGLYSHSDQSLHWQTALPQNLSNLGWGGKLADILHTNNNNQNISMNISLNGVNTFQKGNVIREFSVEPGGNDVTINGSNSTNFYNTIRRQTLDSLLETSYQNIFEKAYADTVRGSKDNAIEFAAALEQGTPITTAFGGDDLSQRLESVAKIIAAHGPLGVNAQTFFVQHEGYDTHDNIIVEHGELMSELDAAINSFYQAVEEIGMQNDVVVFTASDFARKLTSNGDGSDHAWGGNALVLGGSIEGKKIYGDYPSLYLDNPQDVGRGRILPTTSCDELFAELALWMGASTAALPDILPNIENFWSPDPTTRPLGILPA